MDRYICVHGHFYQPPRENPWLESVELQDSALPYHDWNRRIAQECYIANRASRILDGDGRILKIANNYANISFDFGPTLLSWMQDNIPDTYESILEADRQTRERFGGHGSAMAQGYNHMILPLANARDKYTQVLWGIRDFQSRFGRFPESLWLPETAVDLATLEVLAELGIKFTVLAPHQAGKTKPIVAPPAADAPAAPPEPPPAGVDPSTAYVLKLPSGRTINLFFYDGPVSRAVAFEKLLTSGETFAGRLMSAFSDARQRPQLVHIATDGETYGHHHPHGDMALAYAMHHIQAKQLAQIINYGQFLEKFPPAHEVEIVENSSWSCSHGVERWRSDCGCNSGNFPAWRQAWRAPLREALDWLRDRLAPLFEERAGRWLKDPWSARNDYISVILHRTPEETERFLSDHALRPLSEDEKISVTKLMEMQRHAMLMYTSCGWFFDELSGIETVQILQYAGRAIQLADDLFDAPIEEEFLARLEKAASNVPENVNGRVTFEKFVRPAMVDLSKAGAHYVISSLFETYTERQKIYCYSLERREEKRLETGKTRLLVGQVQVTSDVTCESTLLNYAVLYLGGHHLTGGVRPADGPGSAAAMVREISGAFSKSDFPAVIRLMERNFGSSNYSLKTLFKDEQRKILDAILESTLADIETVYRQIYEQHAPLARFLADLMVPLPKAIHTAAEFVITAGLRREIQKEPVDLARVRALLEEAHNAGVALDAASLAFTLRQQTEHLAGMALCDSRDPAADVTDSDLAALETLDAMVSLAAHLPFDVYLWRTQNTYYDALHRLYPVIQARAAQHDLSRRWVGVFLGLGDKLKVKTA